VRSDEYVGASSADVKTSKWKKQRAAYKAAFQFIYEHVSSSITLNGNVEKLSVVHEKYLQHIHENASQWYNPDHRVFKFKAKLAVPF
jgi:hypothetical protein